MFFLKTTISPGITLTFDEKDCMGMRRMVLVLAAGLLISAVCAAQHDGEMEKIAAFMGVSSEEELSEEVVERLSDLIRRQLKINLLPRSRLIASGLFSSYQVASLLDYRQRHGYVLSFSELASVDGFGSRYVELLRPFVSLDTGGETGVMPVLENLRNDLALRGGCRYSVEELDWQYGLKYGIDVGERFQASIGVTRSRAGRTPAPDFYTASTSYDFKKVDARLVLGDFNARFGQGLLAWNGAFLTSLATPSGFMKKASGVSAVRSFTGSVANTGAAAEFGIGRFTLSAATAVSGLEAIRSKPEKLKFSPLLNVRWWNKIGSVSLTATADFPCNARHFSPEVSTSVDASLCIRGVNIFGEYVFNWMERKNAFVAGTDFTLSESLRLAALTTWRQGKQWQWAISGEMAAGEGRNHLLTFSTDVISHLVPKEKDASSSVQLKSQVRWEWKTPGQLTLRLRLSDRFRTWGVAHRAELRAEVAVPLGMWAVDARTHLLYCRSLAVLGYVEASCKTSQLTARLRVGAFRADNWDDRIYVYEYDIPGSFNVPAYYGRGVWSAFALSWKITYKVRLYARASYIACPFDVPAKQKPGRAELKIQTVFRF